MVFGGVVHDSWTPKLGMDQPCPEPEKTINLLKNDGGTRSECGAENAAKTLRAVYSEAAQMLILDQEWHGYSCKYFWTSLGFSQCKNQQLGKSNPRVGRETFARFGQQIYITTIWTTPSGTPPFQSLSTEGTRPVCGSLGVQTNI